MSMQDYTSRLSDPASRKFETFYNISAHNSKICSGVNLRIKKGTESTRDWVYEAYTQNCGMTV